jgi:hypothetical protein
MRVPDTGDLYGVCWLSVAGLPSVPDYYRTMAALVPKLHGADWMGACTGFYVSADADCFLRLLYFTRDRDRPLAVIGTWIGPGLARVRKPQLPAKAEVAKDYGGQEAAFRAYLCTYTQYGLDMLERDRDRSRHIFAAYRLQAQPAGVAARGYLEPSLLELSSTYARSSASDRRRFWSQFESRWDWQHMFVNMVLAGDWDCRGRDAASDAQVDDVVRRQGLGL